uniref:Uncharacterized protein n=1 Tax=Daphnia magna TaxID=35525 RepID=A0A0P5CM84_9CRUS
MIKKCNSLRSKISNFNCFGANIQRSPTIRTYHPLANGRHSSFTELAHYRALQTKTNTHYPIQLYTLIHN